MRSLSPEGARAAEPTTVASPAAASPALRPGVPERALARPGELSARDVMSLQRLAGNRGTRRILRPIQAKLVVGAAHDRYEAEADRVASRVVGDAPGEAPQISRLGGAPELRCDFAPSFGSSRGGAAPAAVASGVDAQRSGGDPLPAGIRDELEPRFGHDFSRVRIHTDREADRLNRSLGSHAFTSGRHVFFRHGAWAPESERGRRLLAHELTHVVQQGERADAVQRYVGFEAELEAPSYGPPPARVDRTEFHDGSSRSEVHFDRRRRREVREIVSPPATPAIVQFLTGHLDYSKDRGHNTDFKIGTDHGGDFGDWRKDLYQKLVNNRFADRVRQDEASNIEYATLNPPHLIDELAPGSNQRIREITDAVRDHVQRIVPRAKNHLFKIPGPAQDIWTGIPRRELEYWLGRRADRYKRDIDDCADAISDELYIQVTTGIIPGSIPRLFRSRTTNVVGRGNTIDQIGQASYDETHAGVRALLRSASFAQDQYVRNLDANSYDALTGVLYLIHSYLIGHAVAQTTGLQASIKNAVPFLIQTDPGRIIGRAATRSLDNDPVPDRLITVIENFLKARPLASAQGWINQYGVARRANAKELIDWPTFVRDVLEGNNDVFTPSPNDFDLSPQPNEASQATDEQRGVPLEHRYIQERPSSSELYRVIMDVVNEVRDLNLRNVPDRERREIERRF